LICLIFSAFFIFSVGIKQFSYKQYIIYFNKSTSGLKVGSSVQYHGVPIGVVSSIEVDLPKAVRVKVTVDINKKIPIYSNTLARLGMQGLTGYSIVELSSNGKTGDILSGYKPNIKSATSMLEELSENLPNLIGKIGELVNSLHKVLVENRSDLGEIIKNLSSSSKDFSKITHDLKYSVKDFRYKLLPSAINSFDDFSKIVASSKDSIIRFSNVGLDQAVDLIDNLNSSAKMLKNILKAVPGGPIGAWIGDISEN